MGSEVLSTPEFSPFSASSSMTLSCVALSSAALTRKGKGRSCASFMKLGPVSPVIITVTFISFKSREHGRVPFVFNSQHDVAATTKGQKRLDIENNNLAFTF